MKTYSGVQNVEITTEYDDIFHRKIKYLNITIQVKLGFINMMNVLVLVK